jgi:hypothetical protein
MKYLIIISIFFGLLNFANADCEVNGYYKANGTWVDGYTRSGDCWQGNIKNYDSEGRSDEDRMKDRRKYLLIFIPIFLVLLFIHSKLKEDSYLANTFGWIVGLLGLYLGIVFMSDSLLIGILIFIGIVYYYIKDSSFIKKRTYTLNITLSKQLEKEFKLASKKLVNIEKTLISRELSVALYQSEQRIARFKNEIFVTFECDNYGIIIKKKDGIASSCYLLPLQNLDNYENESKLIEGFPD